MLSTTTRIVGQLNYQDGWDDATWQSAVSDRALVLFRRLFVVFGARVRSVSRQRQPSSSCTAVAQQCWLALCVSLGLLCVRRCVSSAWAMMKGTCFMLQCSVLLLVFRPRAQFCGFPACFRGKWSIFERGKWYTVSLLGPGARLRSFI